MKHLLIVALLVGVFGCASAGPAPHESKDAHCLYLDNPSGFARCETNEVVCYVSKSGQQCWVKQTPKAPAPLKK